MRRKMGYVDVNLMEFTWVFRTKFPLEWQTPIHLDPMSNLWILQRILILHLYLDHRFRKSENKIKLDPNFTKTTDWLWY